MELTKGSQNTELGPIPIDWEEKSLAKIFKLKQGFAFSSKFFSKTGPIVLTPGNFKLEGGLYFEDRNTKRFSGDFSPEMVFKKNDLLIVMTDLTPECNLLGKPAFVDSDEVILHNQRIGKVVLVEKSTDIRFLFYSLLSKTYLKHIKEQAFGSTVRHTSNKSIYSAIIPYPKRKEEQKAIAEALSDVDALIDSLDRLIAKKRDLKQATMQQLLTGKTRLPGYKDDWIRKTLGAVGNIQRGASPRPIDSPIWFDQNSDVGWVRISDVTKSGIFLKETNQRLSPQGIAKSRPVNIGSLIMSICATVGRPIITAMKTCIHDGFVVFDNLNADKFFLYYALQFIEPDWSKHGQTGSQMNLNTGLIKNTAIPMPPTAQEQNAIATVLSKIDLSLITLEQRLEKTKAIKQGMMQELLTGRTRLV
ncbi:MAG: restriction endonuclease subunit S [Candidatus Rifleibacteriota bacterium]